MNGILLDLAATAYPAVRRAMGPDRVRLDDAELEGLLAELFPGAGPDMHDLQAFGRRTRLTTPCRMGDIAGTVRNSARGMLGTFRVEEHA